MAKIIVDTIPDESNLAIQNRGTPSRYVDIVKKLKNLSAASLRFNECDKKMISLDKIIYNHINYSSSSDFPNIMRFKNTIKNKNLRKLMVNEIIVYPLKEYIIDLCRFNYPKMFTVVDHNLYYDNTYMDLIYDRDTPQELYKGLVLYKYYLKNDYTENNECTDFWMDLLVDIEHSRANGFFKAKRRNEYLEDTDRRLKYDKVTSYEVALDRKCYCKYDKDILLDLIKVEEDMIESRDEIGPILCSLGYKDRYSI